MEEEEEIKVEVSEYCRIKNGLVLYVLRPF